MTGRTERSLQVTSTVAAVLCVGVAAVHIQDQGGVSALADPAWIGWGYRLIEAGGVAVAFALLYCAGARLTELRARLSWVAAALVGIGPMLGYVLTRTVGLPGDPDDVGNWGEPTGVASLVLEALLIVVAASALLSLRRHAVGRTASSARPLPTRPDQAVPAA